MNRTLIDKLIKAAKHNNIARFIELNGYMFEAYELGWIAREISYIYSEAIYTNDTLENANDKLAKSIEKHFSKIKE